MEGPFQPLTFCNDSVLIPCQKCSVLHNASRPLPCPRQGLVPPPLCHHLGHLAGVELIQQKNARFGAFSHGTSICGSAPCVTAWLRFFHVYGQLGNLWLRWETSGCSCAASGNIWTHLLAAQLPETSGYCSTWICPCSGCMACKHLATSGAKAQWWQTPGHLCPTCTTRPRFTRAVRSRQNLSRSHRFGTIATDSARFNIGGDICRQASDLADSTTLC